MKAPVVGLIVALASTIAGSATAAPVVTNLTASQRTGTKLVDIAYDVAAPGFAAVTVSLEISSDAGATWTVPATSATGHVGAGVAPGTGKAIVWDAGVDWAGNYSTQMNFRLVADILVPVGLAVIPGGSFTMGRTSGDTESDAPPVTVTVGTFYLAETETTKAQWDMVRTWAVAHSSPYTDLAAGAGKAADHPVQMVSWWDVVKWCNARSEMEGLTPVYTVGGAVMRTGTMVPDVNWAANGYRLPTEAEWEKSARGGLAGKRFPLGDQISHAEANYYGATGYAYDLSPIDNYHPTYTTGGVPYTSAVGSFSGNGFGLKDMAGNVYEWCWDWFAPGTYTNGATDPRGPASGTFRVFRGGGWSAIAFNARASLRGNSAPTDTYDNVGFRTARTQFADVVDDFSFIPGGSFAMGLTNGDTDSDAPPITVSVSPFYLAVTETTKVHWDTVRMWALAHSSPYTDLAAGEGKAADHPVQTVSWWDVVKWCNARSEMEGLTPVYTVGGTVMRTGTTVPDVNWAANGYRLPTEAEWEKAARGGVPGRRFPRGDTISHAEANFKNVGGESYQSGTTGYHPTYATGGFPYTSPVGSFAANDFGLKNMAGNAFEWCWDWYGGTYYTVSNGTTDPRGPTSGADRVVRGGSWISIAFSARSSCRDADTPTRVADNGFRMARSSVPESGHGSATTDNVAVDTLAAVRPDVAVGASAGALTGVGLYSPTSQVATLISKKAKPVTGYVSVFNRSNRPDVIAVSGTGGSAFFAVTYSGPEGNITAGLLAGTYRTPEMEQGDAPVSIRATITPNKKKLTKKKGKKTVILKKNHTLLIQVKSTFDAAIGDAASISAQTK